MSSAAGSTRCRFAAAPGGRPRSSTSFFSSIGTTRLASLPATTSASASVMRPVNGLRNGSRSRTTCASLRAPEARATEIGASADTGAEGMGLVMGTRWRRVGALQTRARALSCRIPRPCADRFEPMPDDPMTDLLPDRLSLDPRSPYHDADLLGRGVGIRFNGQERTNVEEYCISAGWIRVAAGKALDRRGQPMTMKIKGRVEPYLQDAPGAT